MLARSGGTLQYVCVAECSPTDIRAHDSFQMVVSEQFRKNGSIFHRHLHSALIPLYYSKGFILCQIQVADFLRRNGNVFRIMDILRKNTHINPEELFMKERIKSYFTHMDDGRALRCLALGFAAVFLALVGLGAFHAYDARREKEEDAWLLAADLLRMRDSMETEQVSLYGELIRGRIGSVMSEKESRMLSEILRDSDGESVPAFLFGCCQHV